MKTIEKSVPLNKGEGITVPISKVYPNVWNPNRMDETTYNKALNSLEKFALSSPLICREIPEGFELIDGEHRWRAAQELGMKEVSVWNLGVVSDSVAKQMTILFNELKGQPDTDSLAQLIADLDTELGRQEIEENLPFTSQQIEDLINTLDFDWTAFEAEDEEATEHGSLDTVRVQFICTKEQANTVNAAVSQRLRTLELDVTDENKASALEDICEMSMQVHLVP